MTDVFGYRLVPGDLDWEFHVVDPRGAVIARNQTAYWAEVHLRAALVRLVRQEVRNSFSALVEDATNQRTTR